jgi:hypothetical protein
MKNIKREFDVGNSSKKGASNRRKLEEEEESKEGFMGIEDEEPEDEIELYLGADVDEDGDLMIEERVVKVEGVEGGPPSAPKASPKPPITDKEFYKAMQKLKDRGNNAVPPKKSASAYILFGKEVYHCGLTALETIGNP